MLLPFIFHAFYIILNKIFWYNININIISDLTKIATSFFKLNENHEKFYDF